MRVGFCAAKDVATVRVVCCAGCVLAGAFVQPEAGANAASWYEMPNELAPACSVAFRGEASTPRVEKKFAKSTVGPWMSAARPPTHSICATFLPLRSAAFAIVSACRTPVPENDVRFPKASPLRWNVLFVEPCSPGYVPVAIVYQPTPVFGGKAWVIPFCPSTPAARSAAYVGMAPASAYFAIRSGRMPSDENNKAFFALPTAVACFAAPAP